MALYLLRKGNTAPTYKPTEDTVTIHSHNISDVGISFTLGSSGGKTDITVVIPREDIPDLMSFLCSAIRMGSDAPRKPTREEIAAYVSSLVDQQAN